MLTASPMRFAMGSYTAFLMLLKGAKISQLAASSSKRAAAAATKAATSADAISATAAAADGGASSSSSASLAQVLQEAAVSSAAVSSSDSATGKAMWKGRNQTNNFALFALRLHDNLSPEALAAIKRWADKAPGMRARGVSYTFRTAGRRRLDLKRALQAQELLQRRSRQLLSSNYVLGFAHFISVHSQRPDILRIKNSRDRVSLLARRWRSQHKDRREFLRTQLKALTQRRQAVKSWLCCCLARIPRRRSTDLQLLPRRKAVQYCGC